MKKFLSIILAAMLLIGMLPTAFASVDADTGAVTYKFIANSGGGHADVTGKTATLQDNSGNKYFTSYGTDRDWAYLGTNITAVVSNDKVIDLFTSQRTSAVAKDSWVAYKIRVPETATYTVSGTAYHDKSGGTNKMDIYIAPLTDTIATTFTDSSTYTKSFTDLGISDADYLVGSVNNHIEETHGTVASFVMFTGEFKDVSLDEDTEYVLIFNQASSKEYTLSPASLTLTPEIVTVTPTITASDDTEIFIGDTATLSAVVTDSTGATVSNPTVTYTTEDTDIVSVNAETGVVTGLKEGTATITATYVENETDYTDTVTITVKSATVTYKFYSAYTDEDAPSDITNARIVTVESAVGTKSYTDYGTDRPWAYLGASSASAVSSADYIRIFNGYLGTGSVKKDNWVAFKIKVLKTAAYSISGMAYLYSGGSNTVEMYIAPLTEDIKTTFETASAYSTVSDGTRIAGKSFGELGISGYHVGTASMYAATDTKGQMQITDTKECILREGTEYVLVLNQGYDGTRALPVRSITLTPHDIEPKVTVTASPSSILKGDTATLGAVVTDANADVVDAEVTYSTNDGSIISIDNVNDTVTGLAEGTATITATATVGGKTVTGTTTINVSTKKYEYIFSLDVLKGDILNNITSGESYQVFYDSDDNGIYDSSRFGDYTYIDTEKSLQWAITTLGGHFNSVEDVDGNAIPSEMAASNLHKFGYLQIVGRKTLNHTDDADARAVLKLNIPASGSYNITADMDVPAAGSGGDTGTEADVYIIPASSVTGNIAQAYLKTLPIVGRASSVAGKEDGDIGNYTFASAGDYYMVFNFNSTNTETGNQKQFFNIAGITLSEGSAQVETPATATASDPNFMATANISEASVTVTGAGEGPVHSVARGTTVTLFAPEVDGYNFVGWMRGAYKDNGAASKFIDLTENENGTYSYQVWSSIYLTAVYEPVEVSGEEVVRFWNYDGSFLAEKPVSALDADNLPTASLIGHSFLAWWVAENKALDITALTTAVTNAVAQYTANATASVKVNGVDKDNLTYGKAIPCADNGGTVTHWLRDGEVVSYNPTYTHYAWGSTNIYSSYASVTAKPVVVLAKTTVDGAYMIEYEAPAGYTIAEVGILFAASGTPDINSKLENYSSQRGTSRGQFAAAPSDESYTVARGYMTYIEDATGNAYTIYSK